MSMLETLKNNPAIAAKLAAPKAEDGPKKEPAHTITPEAAVADGRLFLSIALEDLAGCKPSTVTVDDKGKQRGGNLGFMMKPVDFEIDGVRFKLGGGWHTFDVRK